MISICIDPGHGGSNLGATAGELVEKDITLAMARELAQSLEGLPLSIDLTRYEDEDVSLGVRGELSAAFGADFVLSIHVNAFRDTSFRGADMFHWPGNSTGEEVARAMASAMPHALQPGRVRAATPQWDRVRNVIRRHRATAVLAECGFATNPRDNAYLMSRWGRSAIVCALRAGVVRFAELNESALVV